MTDLVRLRGPRAVFLDIGGPVYDDDNFRVAAVAALQELRAERGLRPVEPGAFARVYDAVRSRQSGSLRSELSARFLGGDADRIDLGVRIRQHWRHPPGTLMPDVLPFLRSLRGRVVIGVLANQEASVVDALRRDGLGGYIDVWGVSALVGAEKPSRELFEWCLDRAGVTAAEAVHVGNRLDTDVRPAHALGLGTVWLVRGEAPDRPTVQQLAEPDLAVPTLDGLGEVFFP